MPDPDKCLRQMGRISVTVTRHSPQGDGDIQKRSGCEDRTRNSAAQFVQSWSECIFAELCKTERKRESLSQPVGRSLFLAFDVLVCARVDETRFPHRPAVKEGTGSRESPRVAVFAGDWQTETQVRPEGIALSEDAAGYSFSTRCGTAAKCMRNMFVGSTAMRTSTLTIASRR